MPMQKCQKFYVFLQKDMNGLKNYSALSPAFF